MNKEDIKLGILFVDFRISSMMMLSLRLLLLAWSGAFCFVPLAWTSVMESASQQNQILAEEFEDALMEDELDNQENILTQVKLLKKVIIMASVGQISYQLHTRFKRLFQCIEEEEKNKFIMPFFSL